MCVCRPVATGGGGLGGGLVFEPPPLGCLPWHFLVWVKLSGFLNMTAILKDLHIGRQIGIAELVGRPSIHEVHFSCSKRSPFNFTFFLRELIVPNADRCYRKGKHNWWCLPLKGIGGRKLILNVSWGSFLKRLANCSCRPTEQNHKHSSALLLRFDSVICFLFFIMLMVVVYFFMFSGGRLLGEDWILNFVFYAKESVPIFFP